MREMRSLLGLSQVGAVATFITFYPLHSLVRKDVFQQKIVWIKSYMVVFVLSLFCPYKTGWCRGQMEAERARARMERDNEEFHRKLRKELDDERRKLQDQESEVGLPWSLR